jgi:hypothetical protein
MREPHPEISPTLTPKSGLKKNQNNRKGFVKSFMNIDVKILNKVLAK